MKHDHVSTQAQHPGWRVHPHRQHIRPLCPGTHLLRSPPSEWSPRAHEGRDGSSCSLPPRASLASVPCPACPPAPVLVSWGCHGSEYYQPGGLKQQKCLLSKFGRPDVLNPGVCRASSSHGSEGEAAGACLSSGSSRRHFTLCLHPSLQVPGVSQSPSSYRKPVSAQGPPHPE